MERVSRVDFGLRLTERDSPGQYGDICRTIRLTSYPYPSVHWTVKPIPRGEKND